ncbi:2-deoxy-D-gluconate 3-dehydrogenase [Lachnotalea glycerini]|uniref:2-deoxy-D-gluconate 3-dehydrogenase n=1 Tax=Lachnotalea glycerini TaxID=1763509 RepID=A0A318END8_9FIRM|nr:SDR family oxidoreductase [Lachnotalea glycerini]PXV91629.1 2-deoxy-D-gluconate 3-dehydrogenase [Lachnotalea glycerini]
MNFRLDGKKAIVTGGGSGLCYKIAEGMHEAGAEIVLLSVGDEVATAAEELGKSGALVYAVSADLSDIKQLKEAYEKSLEYLGGHLDILVNGAGVQYRCEAADFPIEQWERVIGINLNAVFYIAQLAGRTMLNQHYGKIINIASMTAFLGSTNVCAYTASKGGVAQLTKALSNEWAGKGINVNAIAPGYMQTAMTADMKEKNPAQYEEITSRIPMGRWGQAEDLKGIAVFLASDEASYISGAIIPVDGGYLGK